jgi:hypothetical protein
VPGVFNFKNGKITYTTNTTVKPSLDTWNLVNGALGLGPCVSDECQQKYVNMYANCIILADQRFQEV